MIFLLKKQKRNIGKENTYLTENVLSRNELWCVVDDHNYLCHVCSKEFLDFNFNQAVIDNQISYIHKNCKFLSIIGII